MSFTFRSRPSLRERLRGKTGEEILNEMKNSMDEESKNFFKSCSDWNESKPSPSFPKGFPFDDDAGTSRESDWQSTLDKLSEKHPELAKHFNLWDSKKESSDFDLSDNNSNNKKDKIKVDQFKTVNNLSNTVPNMQQMKDNIDDRGHRSMSAPPITEQNGPQDQVKREPHVRHIPIFVEGRDEPVLPKDSQATSCNQFYKNSVTPPGSRDTAKNFTQHVPHYRKEFTSTPLRNEFVDEDLPSFSQKHHQKDFVDKPREYFKQNEMESPTDSRKPPVAPQNSNRSSNKERTIPIHFDNNNKNHTTREATVQGKEEVPVEKIVTKKETFTESQSTPSHSNNVPMDSLQKIGELVQQISILKDKVNEYEGKSRKDKGYLYLDEMLTRVLIKLDDIETGGRDEVRSARKDAIKNVQDCISLLESKATSQNSVSNELINAENEMDTIQNEITAIEPKINESVQDDIQIENANIENKESANKENNDITDNSPVKKTQKKKKKKTEEGNSMETNLSTQ